MAVAPTPIESIILLARRQLIEPQPKFWSDDELVEICIAGIKDLWRSIADLKQDHFISINNNVTMQPNSNQLTGVPTDVHKVYTIEPVNMAPNSVNVGLLFRPLPYNDRIFQQARAVQPIDPTNDTIFYAVHSAGAPAGAPTIQVAPQVTSTVQVSFVYVPSLDPVAVRSTGNNPIPGESDNALVAWTVAYARAKESDNRIPDPGWLAIYGTEKAALLQALGVRQYQELPTVNAMWEDYW